MTRQELSDRLAYVQERTDMESGIDRDAAKVVSAVFSALNTAFEGRIQPDEAKRRVTEAMEAVHRHFSGELPSVKNGWATTIMKLASDYLKGA